MALEVYCLRDVCNALLTVGQASAMTLPATAESSDPNVLARPPPFSQLINLGGA